MTVLMSNVQCGPAHTDEAHSQLCVIAPRRVHTLKCKLTFSNMNKWYYVDSVNLDADLCLMILSFRGEFQKQNQNQFTKHLVLLISRWDNI